MSFRAWVSGDFLVSPLRTERPVGNPFSPSKTVWITAYGEAAGSRDVFVVLHETKLRVARAVAPNKKDVRKFGGEYGDDMALYDGIVWQ
jgi:hypothetical protein